MLLIAGGGLAGLALSIQCAQAGYRTVLFEKEKYPFHKVCGEYISFESWNFLEELGRSAESNEFTCNKTGIGYCTPMEKNLSRASLLVALGLAGISSMLFLQKLQNKMGLM
jgi:flavin-dependent dehydrogenase